MRSLAYLIVATTIVAACGSGVGPNPALSSPVLPTPTPPGAVVVAAVTITAASATASVFQLVARARFSDGTTRDVTSAAQWDSSNTSVAWVSQSGFVTIVATGDVEVRATYQGVTGSFPLRVGTPPPRLMLQGVVWEVVPNQRPLQGARVEIMEGPDAGMFAISDATGTYRFSGLHSGVTIIRASLDGYQKWQGGFTLSADRRVDAWLAPNPPKDVTGATATARCKDGTWSWSQDAISVCAASGGIAYFVCPGPFCLTP